MWVDNMKWKDSALQPGMRDSAVSAYCLCMSIRMRHQLVSALTETRKALRAGAAAEIYFFFQRSLKID